MEVWQLGGSEQVCHRNDRTVLFFTRVCLLAALARRYKGKISVRSIIVSRTLHTNIIQPSFSRLWHYDRTITSPLHLITGQVCRGETPGRLWMSLVAFPSCRLKPSTLVWFSITRLTATSCAELRPRWTLWGVGPKCARAVSKQVVVKSCNHGEPLKRQTVVKVSPRLCLYISDLCWFTSGSVVLLPTFSELCCFIVRV